MPPVEGVIEVAGQPVRVLRAGGGAPVVVLHGWGGRAESMAPVISCLHRSYDVLAVDLPGFGGSPQPADVWGSPEYATLVHGVMTAAGIDRARFVGHSFGAKTALWLAAERPDAVERLVIVGSPGIRTPPSARARLRRALSRAGRAAGALGPPGRRLRAALYDRIASTDYKEAGPLRPILVRVVNEDLAPILPKVAAPTLLVWGSEDDAVPLAHARAMERLIPDAGLVVFEGAGHFAYLDEADRFCRIVLHFFEAA